MLGLIEVLDQLVVAMSVYSYGCALRTEEIHVLRRALRLKVKRLNVLWERTHSDSKFVLVYFIFLSEVSMHCARMFVLDCSALFSFVKFVCIVFLILF